MKKKAKAIRHGDLCLVQVDSLPKDLQPSSTQTLMQGSGGNNHDVKDGTVYLTNVDQFVFGYLVAHEGCTLIHPDHGKKGKGNLRTAKVPAGTYELRRQFEQTHTAMTPVID